MADLYRADVVICFLQFHRSVTDVLACAMRMSKDVCSLHRRNVRTVHLFPCLQEVFRIREGHKAEFGLWACVSCV